ncbi:tRNA uracil 4-sulfurtransferase ThiI [Hydrogenibacillus sp. N12]|uniref:tRNA uracil 4-sulfurtransferase ThiI n=1 Tax=Hydrogenibacillus sp. N12 TaxID=2866627 RepID=UPI00207BE630|nr:tRNA uracil 4-sulfurtransferase ThiI [Hydrogenibacillus sp. N12]
MIDVYTTVLIRFGELALKGKNRADFEARLIQDIKRRLKVYPELAFWRTHGRLYIELGGTPYEAVAEPLQRIFGLISFSPAIRVPLDLEAIQAAALRLVEAARPKTFKVSARRTARAFPVPTPELMKRVGAYVLKRVPGLKVDVHTPEQEVMVEVRQEGAFVYDRVVPGAGGFPVGTSGKVVLLLSGGIDSPVAGWYIMRKGAEVEAVYYHSPPYTSERAKLKVVELARLLSFWSGRVRLRVVPFTEIQEALKASVPEPLLTTFMRRYMMRIAERIADEVGALALATGESLGQVASQTLENLHVIAAATRLPVLRPLIGLDKTEIIALARKIGTYETSILPYEDCCTVFTPAHPQTKPKLAKVEAIEARAGLDREGMIGRALQGTEVLELSPETPPARFEAELELYL